ncbi:hypothetical protein I6E09_15080 [Mediterraneibacter glycyrrhizinilyticus]|nr:hypothetical protein [Mediterraneibacter glycyrrhizinilyticus]
MTQVLTGENIHYHKTLNINNFDEIIDPSGQNIRITRRLCIH